MLRGMAEGLQRPPAPIEMFSHAVHERKEANRKTYLKPIYHLVIYTCLLRFVFLEFSVPIPI